MGRFIVNRVFSMGITLLLVITITFALMHAIPGGPFTREKALPPAVMKALEAKFNLDQPLWRQYVDYLGGVIKGDLGPSFQRTGVTVNKLIEEGFPISAKIGGLSVLLVLILGVPIGIISALKQNKWQDQLAMFLATLGVTIPSFVLGTLIIYIFSAKLGWLPSYGLKSWKHYIGPVIALGGFSLSFVARLTRSSMLEVLQQDYIRTARAKGLSEFVVVGKHALKNALIPVVTYVGPLVAAILTGSFVVEKIFAIPGMGKHFVESVGNRDYTVLMGITIFYAIFLVVMVLLVDITYGLIDPRIKMDE
ncbi:oligopeptide transport system permease protein [Marinisporobacter balticus]|uniref:Oligopeptide transport system permease protein n=1 Tax=Marinisporobacter balticus TaxID=2018667 RepID=A0A4R2KT52_9FIRM|nr:ABC transporter permease [Marinisporobacter balticus]TCO69865.1 oligopeptide transport system permease protein [Marinisporobacter balticus]